MLSGAVFVLLWALLWRQFWQLQVVQGPEFAERARRQYLTTETLAGKRGSILDRNGKVLAASVESYSLSARPSEIEDMNAAVRLLSRVLGKPEAKIRSVIGHRRGFVWVARKIPDGEASQIAGAKIKGLYLEREYERVYPYKQLAGQLLGFVGMDNKGLDGLEAFFDDRLSGREYTRLVQRDGRGGHMYLEGTEDTSALAGRDIRLTIDMQVQFFAEAAVQEVVDEYRARWGGCLVVDVRSGDILAWAHYPFFNPNAYNKYDEFTRRNKLALEALEQGSTIKPFLVASALNEGVVTPDTVFKTENGKWFIRSHTIRDTKPTKELTVAEILKYSSNIGAGKIGLELGSEKYGRYLHELGFGEKTGLPLVSESTGILRNTGRWPDMDLITASFGQSFSATTLQMAQAYLTLANGGARKSLQLIKDADMRMPERTQQIFSPESASTVLGMMREVVQSDDGGGRRAKIAGVEIAGKTGTAQKASAGVYGKKRVASFVGLVPARSPEYLVLVVVDEPDKAQYGALVAVPVFRQVVMQTLAYTGMLPDPNDPDVAQLVQEGKLKVDPAFYAQMKAREDAESRTNAILQGSGGVAVINTAARKKSVAEVIAPVANTELMTTAEQSVPNVVGQNVRSAVEAFAHVGIVPTLSGRGETIVKQSPEPGTPLLPQNIKGGFTLWLGEKSL